MDVYFSITVIDNEEAMKRNIVSIIITLVVLTVGTSAVYAENAGTLKKLLMSLPDKAFPASLNEIKNSDGIDSLIEICDEENRYLSFKAVGDVDYWEMCYWNLKGGKEKLILVNSELFPSFYLYSNGKALKTEKFGIRDIWKKIGGSSWENFDQYMQFFPPRSGTAITVILNNQDCMIFKWQNETFVCLTDYPKKKNNHHVLARGFADALNTRDADICLQYILPQYVAAQCMDMLQGRTEQFICELIGGGIEDTGEYITPSSLKDIKKATYKYDPDNGLANHIIFIQLQDGRSYHYYMSFESVEADMRTIPYITGAMG